MQCIGKSCKTWNQKEMRIPFHDKYEITDLDDSDCGTDGCKLDENGIGIRWED